LIQFIRKLTLLVHQQLGKADDVHEQDMAYLELSFIAEISGHVASARDCFNSDRGRRDESALLFAGRNHGNGVGTVLGGT
jgi:hypothetical protein